MGALDDAIREHLELKRRLGASEDEVERQEQEAFGRGTAPRQSAEEPSDVGAAPGDETDRPRSEPALDEPAPPAADVEPPPAPAPLPDAADVNGNGVAAAPLPDELEPDEVLPEESLEPELPPQPAAGWGDDELEPDELGSSADVADDVLEATPEFLDEESDQEQLWFERKSPKDFDFD